MDEHRSCILCLQVKLDEAQLAEQEALRKKLQQEQDLLQRFQESQEAKLLVQHEREKHALDEKVEASKLELEKQVSKELYKNMFKDCVREVSFLI